LDTKKQSASAQTAHEVTYRDRTGETLFIDACNHGSTPDRRHNKLTESSVAEIVDTYHAWRDFGYADIPFGVKMTDLTTTTSFTGRPASLGLATNGINILLSRCAVVMKHAMTSVCLRGLD
jgi:type I restriction-modification system DNA methylase subunit